MKFDELDNRAIATILAALRLFQQIGEKTDLTVMFPEHFEEGISPLSAIEIDFLCEDINASTQAKLVGSAFAWSQLTVDLNVEDDAPLARLKLHLNYAVEDGDLFPNQAFDVLKGERGWIFDINRAEDRDSALKAFDELQALGHWETCR